MQTKSRLSRVGVIEAAYLDSYTCVDEADTENTSHRRMPRQNGSDRAKDAGDEATYSFKK